MNAPTNIASSTPWRWRSATVHDLDWFPQESERLLLVRYVQKRGVLSWPAMTLVFGDVVALVVGTAPNEDNGVDLWATFSPFAHCAGFAVARACRRQFAAFLKDWGGKPIRITLEHGNARAARFARWLGFRSTGANVFIAQFGASMELWQWAI